MNSSASCSPPVSAVYIDRAAADAPLAARIRSAVEAPCEIVEDAAAAHQAVTSAPDPAGAGKTVLFLTRNKGRFIRSCPGTRHYRCCGYQIIHVGTYCTMDCAYCILQAYFHPPVLQFFVNHDDLFRELDAALSQKAVSRYGTGEFTDSLIWEPWTGLSERLVPKFAAQSSAILELKTKTVAVEKLKALRHNRKIIAAWSLNTEKMVRSQERFTAPVADRLAAAARCESWGYPLAFHFDPLIIEDGSAEDYCRVIEEMFAHASPDNIAWISLGTFRFMPDLKSVIQKRFPDSEIIYGEFIRGLDGKMRYFKPLRIDLYRRVIACIRDFAPDVTLYFCMEDDDVWEKTMGFRPADKGGLPAMLDRGAKAVCGLDANP